MTVKRFLLLAAVAAAAVMLGGMGCSAPLTTNTPRSAVEQQLLATVIERAMGRVSFIDYAGKKVFPDYANLAPQVDKPYVQAVFEMQLARYGIEVVADGADADYIVQVNSGVLATDQSRFLFGTPALPIPVPDTSISIVIPEIALLSKFTRKAFGRFSFNILTPDHKPVTTIRGINATAHHTNWVILLLPFISHDMPLDESETVPTHLKLDI